MTTMINAFGPHLWAGLRLLGDQRFLLLRTRGREGEGGEGGEGAGEGVEAGVEQSSKSNRNAFCDQMNLISSLIEH